MKNETRSNLLETLKQSLTQTVDARERLSRSLAEIENETPPNRGETKRIAAEIELLTDNIRQTELAIESLKRRTNDKYGIAGTENSYAE